MGEGTDRIVRWLAVLALVAGTIEILTGTDVGNRAAGVAALIVMCAAFAVALDHPAGSALAIGVALAAQSLLGSHATDVSGFMLIPFIGVIFIWGLRAPLSGWWGLLALTIGVGISVASDSADRGEEVASSIAWVVVFMVAAPAAAGRIMRARASLNERLAEQAEEIERNREARARAARIATRASIAHELHDIVAHEVSVMVVQAQAARLGVQRGSADAASSIEAIETTGREALTQMRRLLGVLRHDDERIALAPQPTLRRVDVLVEQARARGLDVTLSAADVAEHLPPGVDLTAYRIAQEALQSATDHGGATRAEARIATRNGQLEMDLDADGPIAQATLAGLHERAAMVGGTLDVEPRADGGTLHVRIPLRRATTGAAA
jgi:signal transduction histidine kinase